VGSNFPINEKLTTEETTFAENDPTNSANARHKRWLQVMADNKGKIDVELAQQFLADHKDSVTGKVEANERTLCGHVEASPRGMGDWQKPYGTAGAAQNKAADAAMISKMSFTAAAGHACGTDFHAASHLQELRDMKAYPWTRVRAE
jgi:hypothetical protein